MKIPAIRLLRPSAVSLSDQGFTLAETLLAFTAFTVIVFFVSPLLQVILPESDQKAHLKEMEWDVFCSQVKNEIHSSSNVLIADGGQFVFTTSSGTITYEKYENSLRRKVNNTGHEILLQNVANVSFNRLKNAVEITVTDLSGKDFIVTVYSFINWDDFG